MKENFWKNLPRPIAVLAPMEDVTDTVFRRLIARCGRPHVFFSEFTSADGMFSRGAEQVMHRLRYSEEERPLVAQIWGNHPENYYRAAQLLFELGFDGIDINMGCPVEKIVKSGHCSALIENPSLAAELYQAAREGSRGLPLSIKTRLGFSDLKTEEWTGFLLDLDPDALIVHGRIAKHLSKYKARWDEIAKVVELRNQMKSSCIILGNGDVTSLKEIQEKVNLYGVDGVMVGRGIFDNLFLFEPDAVPLRARSVEEKLQLFLDHMQLQESEWSGIKPFRVLKKFVKIYAVGFRGASELRAKLVTADSFDEARSIIREFLDRDHARDVDAAEVSQSQTTC